MDYKKIYNQIIERAKSRELEGYIERHHIIPKCMGGDNNKTNIVQLTAREHYLCHLLLVKIYPNEPKLIHSLFLMSIGKKKKKINHYKINNRLYERLKIEYALFLTGKKQSEITKNKKSKSMKIIWANKSKDEMSKKAQKVWDTRRKNGNINVTKQQAYNISLALKNRKTPWLIKPISQYSLDNEWIRDWESQAEIKKHPDYGNIQGCLNSNQKTAYGFKWKFKN